MDKKFYLSVENIAKVEKVIENSKLEEQYPKFLALRLRTDDMWKELSRENHAYSYVFGVFGMKFDDKTPWISRMRVCAHVYL